MSIKPPSPDGSTGITTLTLGSALTETFLTAPVSRSATRADWLSGSMISPLVLSRQPCITPGAGQSLGKGFGGNGGGGGGVVLAPGPICGWVVNGSDCASLNRAQPDPANSAAHSSASTPRNGRRCVMHARLRMLPRCAPRRSSQIAPQMGARKRRANARLAHDLHLRWKLDQYLTRPARVATARRHGCAARVSAPGRPRRRHTFRNLRR